MLCVSLIAGSGAGADHPPPVALEYAVALNNCDVAAEYLVKLKVGVYVSVEHVHQPGGSRGEG